jgi:predicted ATPase/DNA-binding SARP family transcriptional activator
VTLSLGLLGPLEVISDGQMVRIVGVKERAVLALLALAAPRALSTERLVEELWGDELPESGSRPLRVLVSRLRKTLADSGEVIVTGPSGYCLAAAVETDVVRFEALSSRGRSELAAGHAEAAARFLREALGLFRGPPLEDTPGETARVEAARLEEARLAVLEARVESDLACGRHAEIVGELQALTGEFVFRERLWAALMTALYRSGRQADSLRSYQELRNGLAELGIEPSIELRELENAVLLQKPELDWRPLDPELQAEDIEADSRPPGSPEQSTHNLPVQLSSFLGRAEELNLGAKLLAATRLLSLTGPGGIGKTRLAYQLAADRLGQFSDGVWVAELATLSSPELVAATLMAALGLRDESGQSATQTIVSHLRHRETLVILDNCEHVIDAASTLASDLLAGCEKLRVLTTTREPLRVRGESVWTLGPLELPGAHQVDLAVLASTDAVRLFCERAADAKVGFALSLENAPAVTAVCARLEGIPLAIELAAARVRILTVGQIATRLDHTFDLLTKGSRGAQTRQASVQATISWSHDLLSATEQILFRRLSVFAGDFTLEASEGVCAEDGLGISDVIDALDGLIDKSLVALVEERAGQARYRMLETIRAYASERLGAAGEVPLQVHRHAAFYAQLARDCAEMEDTASSLDRLAADHPNLLAAVDQLANSDQPLDHGQLAADLASFWDLHGHWQLASLELPRYLGRPDRDAALSGRCADVLASISLRLGNYDEARARFTEMIDIARDLGDRRLESRSVGGLGIISHERGEYGEARAYLERALEIARDLGDPLLELRWVGGLGTIAGHVKDFPEARARYQEAVSMARRFGDRRFEAMWLGNLGTISKEEGSYGEARAQLEEALVIAGELGDRRTEATWIGTLGELGAILGDYPEARARYGEALDIFRELGDRYAEGEQLGRLGMIACDLGEYPEAEAALEEALAIARVRGYRQLEGEWLRSLCVVTSDVGRYPEAVARCREALDIYRETGAQESNLLDACAELLTRLDHCEDATELLAVADKLNDRTRYARVPSAQARYDATLGSCRSVLDEQTLEAASERGRGLEWASAVDKALAILEGIEL